MTLGPLGQMVDLSSTAKISRYVNTALGAGGTINVRDIGSIDVTLTQDATIDLANGVVGQYVGLVVRQDETGGHGLTVTGADWGVAPRWSTLGGAASVATLYYDGTEWIGLHGGRIQEIVWHGDAVVEEFADRWRFDVRTHILAASFDCDDSPTGGPWIADIVLGVEGVETSIYPNDGARPQIADGAEDGGVIATHTTLVAPAGSYVKAYTKTLGATNPGSHGTLRLKIVEEG